jgi:hypothetical protein
MNKNYLYSQGEKHIIIEQKERKNVVLDLHQTMIWSSIFFSRMEGGHFSI